MNGNMSSTLDIRKQLPYQKLRFRQAYPSGRMVLNPLRLTDQLAIFEAKVFFHRDDPIPAGSFTANKTAKETPSYIRAAQDEALSEALGNAGFGVQAQSQGVTRAAGRQASADSPVPKSTPAADAPRVRIVGQDTPRSPTASAPQPQEKEVPTNAAVNTPAAQPAPQETDGKQQESESTHEAPASAMQQDITRSAPPPEPEASTDGGQKSAVSTLLQFSHQADSQTVVRPEREDASTGAKAAGDNPPAGAAPNQTTPSYTEDMPVEEICRVMTLEEARAVVVTKGTCKGWSMGKVADQRPSSLRFYLSGFGQCSNIQLAAATLLKQDMELDKAG